MAAPGKPSKWGSFLSQAVAGVESRLDNMLAEPDEAQSQKPAAASAASASSSAAPRVSEAITTTAKQSSQQPAPPATSGASKSNSRSSSRSGVNGRLQARLARAMAGKANASGTAGRGTLSPTSSTDQISRPSIEEKSTDKQFLKEQDEATSKLEAEGIDVCSITEPPESLLADTIEAAPTEAPKPIQNATTTEAASGKTSTLDHVSQASEGSEGAKISADEDSASTQPDDKSELVRELQELKDRQQEEIREYTERIDSLQSKLQYLSKTATDAARKAASSALPGSPEQKLAAKDEKIALLMEEGQKLSSNEHKLRSTIKKLRALIGEHEKQVADLKTNRDRAISDAEALRARLDGPEEVERRWDEANRATAALQAEIESLKKENSKKDDAYRRLDQEWKKKTEQAECSHREAMNKALAAERQKQKSLEDLNSSLRTEKETVAEQARQDEIEWREKLERANERGRKTAEELKAELQAVEGKLEAMRVAAEEASSGTGGEAQVKMFRQIETLQSQYASARENWQGIEASLIAKSANLEKERDEAQRRESEMRKKARDAAVRLRHLEDELQDVQPSLASARQELNFCRDEMAELQASYKSCQASLAEARQEVERLKQQGVTDKEDSVEAERRQWVDEVAGATNRGHQSRPESPLVSISRTFSSDLLGLSGPSKSRRSHTPGSISENSPADIMSPTRRATSQTPIRTREPSYAGSGAPPTPFSPFETPSETGHFPSLVSAERDSGALETIPSSPRHVAQDMVSVSTVAAGPSVQLVERMSAAIRRLEAEKVTAKEEMARVCGQRNEARRDLVALMKEIEETKAAASRVPQLEQEVANLDSRYQTTLEMLGEKSELVEELKADVEDVKTMYRELVERTVK
ncbi:hypothetical protein C2857_001181 [Epichloe festucae Fl1]|uniref:TATA element modulatory factor 1 TATA binding domain-containing protein n=1 Tax=Epichloe festucae (strain Fl1) TaxID=877507 RepID=A0A7S9KRE2_EPIFF|nr:hypothetical protein C2857_001181 [Epichloe festucae Fl1]